MVNTTEFVFDPTPLRNARLIKGINITKLAALVDSNISTISLTLNGKFRNPKHLDKLCKVLGVERADCFRPAKRESA